MIDTNFKKSLFCLDAYESEMFEGYTRGETWNGFECPYFPLESAQHLMSVLSAEGQLALYDEKTDQFVCSEEGDEEDADRYGALEVEGLGKLYPIGAWVWAWGKAGAATP